MDPDPGHEHFSRITEFFLTKQNSQIILLLIFAYFMLRLYEPYRDHEIFIISLFSTV